MICIKNHSALPIKWKFDKTYISSDFCKFIHDIVHEKFRNNFQQLSATGTKLKFLKILFLINIYLIQGFRRRISLFQNRIIQRND